MLQQLHKWTVTGLIAAALSGTVACTQPGATTVSGLASLGGLLTLSSADIMNTYSKVAATDEFKSDVGSLASVRWTSFDSYLGKDPVTQLRLDNLTLTTADLSPEAVEKSLATAGSSTVGEMFSRVGFNPAATITQDDFESGMAVFKEIGEGSNRTFTRAEQASAAAILIASLAVPAQGAAGHSSLSLSRDPNKPHRTFGEWFACIFSFGIYCPKPAASSSGSGSGSNCASLDLLRKSKSSSSSSSNCGSSSRSPSSIGSGSGSGSDSGSDSY